MSSASSSDIRNYLTIDVEDYFQVAAFENIITSSSWDDCEQRVVQNTQRVLEMLSRHATKATFFVVGWTAERFPELVKKIRSAGHEVGCHSYSHRKIYELTPQEFRQDTIQAKKILEDILGEKIVGYRAPSYSITGKSLWALDILEELGFRYDSSIFPILHDNYGIPDAPRFEYRLPGRKMMEYPISTALFLRQKVPVAGGGYFRLFPYWFTRIALKKINNQEKKPFIFYLHPWEVDPAQPKMKHASARSRFRHYNNLDKTEKRFARLLEDFEFGPIPISTNQ
ncbi:XrtA system polysaccharide deacetylase [Thermodesulfobacteriota bacterium B35]